MLLRFSPWSSKSSLTHCLEHIRAILSSSRPSPSTPLSSPLKEMTAPPPRTHSLAMLTKGKGRGGTFQRDNKQIAKAGVITHNPSMTDLDRFQIRIMGRNVT